MTARSTTVSTVATDGTTRRDWLGLTLTLADTVGGRKGSAAGGSCVVCC